MPLKGKILNVERARFEKLISSQEIATLITVLGTGIGKDEYNADKLRYHRIIIMTDADVDGSHIRTLLLTFFYRQMPELVERGHIYIAQPPLYKVKQGRDERYLKDDHEMKNYMLRLALVNAELHVDQNAAALKAETLEHLAKEYFLAEAVISRLSQVIAPEALHAMLVQPDIQLDSAQQATQSAARLQAACGPGLIVKAEINPANDESRLRLEKRFHGNFYVSFIEQSFLHSGDFTQIKQTAEALGGLLGKGAYIKRGEQHKPVTGFKQAIEWLLEEAKRGVTIQRYKGLGEMNPGQLWETTMDAKNRILLRVQIEDMIAADEIFTTLMGDVVEPRRAFIEQNALGVKNLDI